MSDTPLTIVLLTYAPAMDHPRAQYAEKTLRTALRYLAYDGPRFVHIADDGSPRDYRAHLADIALAFDGIGVTLSDAGRLGYGHSYNLASQVTGPRGGLVLPLEDDWETLRPFDLTPFAAAIAESDRIEAIRMGYLGWTQPLYGEVVGAAGHTFLLLDPDSPERHVFSGHPRLETVAYERRVGPWPVGLDPGTTEFEVAGLNEARRGVAWPLELAPVGGLFAHIGSVQARSDQNLGVV